MNSKKQIVFEYLLTQLISWFNTENSIYSISKFNESNDLGKDKIIKIHYFICVKSLTENDLLLNIFNDFYATHDGNFESEISKILEENNDKYFNFNQSKLIIKLNSFESLNEKIKLSLEKLCLNESIDFNELTDLIHSTINSLINLNHKFINYSRFDLISLNFQLDSWKSSYLGKTQLTKNIIKINYNLIKEDLNNLENELINTGNAFELFEKYNK